VAMWGWGWGCRGVGGWVGEGGGGGGLATAVYEELQTLAKKTVSMSGTMSCSAPVVSMTCGGQAERNEWWRGVVRAR
jgi:hypothetical protein